MALDSLRGENREDSQHQDSTSALIDSSGSRDSKVGTARVFRYAAAISIEEGSHPGQGEEDENETFAPLGFFGRPNATTAPVLDDTIPVDSSMIISPDEDGRAEERNAENGENPCETFGRIEVNILGSAEIGEKADIRTPVPPMSRHSESPPADRGDFDVATITRDCQRNETRSRAAGAGRLEESSGNMRLAEANNLLIIRGSSCRHLTPRGWRD